MGINWDSISAIIDFIQDYDSVIVLLNILIEFGIKIKIVMLIKSV
jgi:hypothetical protein